MLAARAQHDLDEVCRPHGITAAQYVALWTLCLSDDPSRGLPVGAVADGLINRAADATRLIDRLERAGLVERLANPTDRRGVLVRATEAGRRRFEAVAPEVQAFHTNQWSSLDDSEADELARLLMRVLWGEGAD
jgi:DNA-binding MarR family transcriptional regulator